ncbi:MAG: ATP-binding protein [Melioribacteraceae bacterium]|nr:ATP-binding protein [Melioribacteraceae bacterium]
MATILLHKIVKSNPEVLPELEENIVEIAKSLKLDPIKINTLALSFSEAISNSMKHGNQYSDKKNVEIDVYTENDKLYISLKDEGTGFDISSVPDPTKPENILKESGRGIHIMKNFLDDLVYNFLPNGTQVILVINLK